MNLKYVPCSRMVLSTPSTEMHRFKPLRNLAFYFIDFFSSLSTVGGKVISNQKHSHGFCGKVTFASIMNDTSFISGKKKNMFILGKLSLADITCQQYCSRIPDECWFAASIYKDKMFRTFLGTGINLAQAALSLQSHPSQPTVSNFSDVNKDKEKKKPEVLVVKQEKC